MRSREKSIRVKRIYAFVLIFVVALQSVLGLEQQYLVNGQTIDSVESSEASYTVYFDASKIIDQDSLMKNGVYLYAYGTDSEGNEISYSENPVQMAASGLEENLYQYEMDAPYITVQFLLGDSLDAAVKSEPAALDWEKYAAPCFTMTLTSDENTDSYVVQLELTNLALEDLSESDSESVDNSMNESESGSDSETEQEIEAGSDSESNIAVQSEESQWDTSNVSASSFTPNSDYLYLMTAGMTQGGYDWSTVAQVSIKVDGWTNPVSGKKYSDGYWYWDMADYSDWKNKENKFYFLISENAADYGYTGYSDVNFSDAAGKVYVATGSFTTIENKMAYSIAQSLEGQTIYFADYTLSNSSVSAIFAEDTLFSSTTSETVEMKKNVNGVSGLFSVVIPGAQKYVKFVDTDGNQIGDSYNFYGGTENSVKSTTYEAGTNDTYHYGITEKTTTNTVSNWGAVPEANASSLAGKTLYFDSSSFPIGSAGSIQVGTEEAITLSVDSSSSMLSYTFPEDTDATHQTLLTYITTDEIKYHFTWNDTSYNKVTLTDDIATVSGQYYKATTVYFDATYSKLHYIDDGSNPLDYEIPKSSDCVYYYATGDGNKKLSGPMTKANSYTKGDNTWSDVYKISLPEGYDKIVFSNFSMKDATNYGGHGESTTTLEIPVGLSNPCFYADTGDSSIYDGGTRGGYWAEVYTIRDAESAKETDVVDIDQEEFTSGSGILYVNSTFYDYYTDYELNGSNRDTYGGTNGTSHRSWVTFRQFNQALSDYYSDPDNDSSTQDSVNLPIYTGHFQPTALNGSIFSSINTDLNLFGFNNYNQFMSTNNSNYDVNGAQVDTRSVAQGLVSSSLVNDSLMMETSSENVKEPHFDEKFLTGNNSKNAVLGEVYQNVAFPFVQEDEDEDGVKYWTFDSSKTTLAMKQDTTTNAYYLKDVGNQNWSLNVDSSSNSTGKYGFFPFNETSTATSAKNYNYGYGVKLEFQFRLTEDGYVLDNDEMKVPITFDFSGDDDVWVFIDGQLVLDVGGAHGVATGSINFANKTATVETVKASGAATTLGTSSTFELTGDNQEEHTLTMYYMERGMWESNMKITFNFPDENQLEVEKQVDETNVNELFKGLFDNKSLFTYTIKNQATHYGTKKVETATTSPKIVYDSYEDGSVGSVSGNTFEKVTSKADQNDVIHWYAKLDDKTGSYRSKRYGTITLNNTVDISGMSYLQFKLYYDYNDTPSLNNMYLQIVDENNNVKGDASSYLNNKTYGLVTMAGKKWITIKIDLSKLTEEDGFDGTKVKYIKFGYNYPRDIYLDDFVFYPSVVSSKLVGFITKQYDIPDYGSATSGELMIPEGAIYTSSTGETRAIGKDGTFVLQNNETVTFSDQFRRGSYIYLEEEANDLFETSWTMYDNGMEVTSFGSGSNVKNGSISSMKNISKNLVYDDRTEQVLTGTETTNTGETVNVMNSKYQTAVQPTAGTLDTFVFRSYSNPDDVTTTTKLKVVYTNKVKTGSLIIKKASLYANEMLSGDYTFEITFYNVGGIGLESSSITKTVTLKVGESYEIEGIPLGTCYTVKECASDDGSYLGKVEVSNTTTMLLDTSSMEVQGVITKKTDEATPDFVTFYNTFEPKISASVIKVWKDEVTGKDLETGLPESIYVQLQRREKGNANSVYTVVDNYSKIELKPSYDESAESETGTIVWKYTINGLDKIVDYEKNSLNGPAWEYQFVELDANETVVENGNTFTITTTEAGAEYYKADYETVIDGNGNYSTTMTNTLLGTSLQIIKLTDQNERLSGVIFQLEKYNVTSKTYDEVAKQTTSDKANGDLTSGGEACFAKLENGTYRLTEIQTAEGYSLLKESVIITIDRKNNSYTYHMESDDTAKENLECTLVNGVPTITFSIKNTAKMTLPNTGVRMPIQGVAAGVLLCLMAGILYLIEARRRRKETQAVYPADLVFVPETTIVCPNSNIKSFVKNVRDFLEQIVHIQRQEVKKYKKTADGKMKELLSNVFKPVKSRTLNHSFKDFVNRIGICLSNSHAFFS